MSNLWRCMHGGGGTVCCHWGLRGGGAPPECKEQPRLKGLCSIFTRTATGKFQECETTFGSWVGIES